MKSYAINKKIQTVNCKYKDEILNWTYQNKREELKKRKNV
jgi:hypothetical protein